MTFFIAEDLLVTGDADIQGTVTGGDGDGKNAFFARQNGVGALVQVSPFGNNEQLCGYDNVDTASWGATQENAHRIQNSWYGPVNYVKRHIVQDFNANLGNVVPPEYSLSAIGNTPSVMYQAPSRIRLSTSATGIGSGFLMQMNNFTLNRPADTQVHFCMNMLTSRNVDLQFGLRNSSGTEQLRFRYASTTGSDGVLVCTGERGVNTHTYTSSWNAITERRLFCLRIRKNGDIIFCASDANNVLQTLVVWSTGSSYVPQATTDLIPFLQLRTYDSAQAISLLVDSIYGVFEW